MLFRSEEQVREWCAVRQRPRGETLALDQVWALSKVWYRDRMHPAYRGRTVDQAVRIFESVGLTSPFWKPNA